MQAQVSSATVRPTFTKSDDMLANELSHPVTFPITAVLAGILIRELGNASFMARHGDAAWYIRADHRGVRIPFTLRVTPSGATFIGCSWDEQCAVQVALSEIDPGLEIIPIGVRRPNRLAA